MEDLSEWRDKAVSYVKIVKGAFDKGSKKWLRFLSELLERIIKFQTSLILQRSFVEEMWKKSFRCRA